MSYSVRRSELEKISKDLLRIASSFSDFSMVHLFNVKTATTRFGENEITQNVELQEMEATITLCKDKKTTKVSIDNFDESSVRERFKNASILLDFQKPDPEFPDFPDKLDIIQPENCFFDSTADVTPTEKAKIIADHIDKCVDKDLLASGILTNTVMRFFLSNSKGLTAYHESTNASYSTTVMDENGAAGWATDDNSDINKLEFSKLSNTAIEKSLMNTSPKELETGKYTVILEPAAVTDFLLFLSYKGMATRLYYDGRSPFAGKLGEKILSDKITLIDEVDNPLAPGMTFDFEGIKKQNIVAIENGVFKELPLDIKYSAKAGKPSNGRGLEYPNSYGPMFLSLNLSPGKKSMEEIIAESDKCLLVTHFHYTNLINPNDLTITGTTRDGLFWIEDGKIAYPVKNFRFTQSIIEALNNVIEVSSDQIAKSAFFGGKSIVAGMKISDFNFTSKTEY